MPCTILNVDLTRAHKIDVVIKIFCTTSLSVEDKKKKSDTEFGMRIFLSLCKLKLYLFGIVILLYLVCIYSIMKEMV